MPSYSEALRSRHSSLSESVPFLGDTRWNQSYTGNMVGSPRLSRGIETAHSSDLLTPESRVDVKTRCRSIITFISVGVIHIYCCLPIFIFSLFFPQWATERGISGMWVGTITGVAFLTGTFAALINIQMGRHISPTLSTVIGVLLAGVFTTTFGFLNWIENSSLFLMAAIFVRAVQGFGIILADTNVYVMTNKFAPPQHLSLIIGGMDMLAEMSMAVSPLLGGILYEAGGFSTPFVVLGAVSLVCVACTFAAAPKNHMKIDSAESHPLSELVGAFLNLNMMTYTITFMVVGSSVGFLNGMIQPHLQQFELSTSQMGLMVLVPCFSSSLTFPLWGLLCDRIVHLERLSMMGNFLLGTGFVIFGPLPGLTFTSSVWTLVLGMAICGFGMSAVLTSVYTQGFRYLRRNCLSESLGDSVLSSCYVFSYCMGSFIGAMLGGVFIDYVGYRWGSLILASLHIANVFLQVGLYFGRTARS